jgi:hypothetical protein
MNIKIFIFLMVSTTLPALYAAQEKIDSKIATLIDLNQYVEALKILKNPEIEFQVPKARIQYLFGEICNQAQLSNDLNFIKNTAQEKIISDPGFINLILNSLISQENFDEDFYINLLETLEPSNVSYRSENITKALKESKPKVAQYILMKRPTLTLKLTDEEKEKLSHILGPIKTNLIQGLSDYMIKNIKNKQPLENQSLSFQIFLKHCKNFIIKDQPEGLQELLCSNEIYPLSLKNKYRRFVLPQVLMDLCPHDIRLHCELNQLHLQKHEEYDRFNFSQWIEGFLNDLKEQERALLPQTPKQNPNSTKTLSK